MAVEVEFEMAGGPHHALVERFPLGGSYEAKDGKPVINCLVIQPESGGAPIRVGFYSAEADALRKRFPALNDLDAPTQPDGAPVAAPQASGIDYDALAAAMIRAQRAAHDAENAAAAAAEAPKAEGQ